MTNSSSIPPSMKLWWRDIRLMSQVFDLREPSSFPVVGRSSIVGSIKVINRYVSEARELSKCEFYTKPQSIHIRLGDDRNEEFVTTVLASKELYRGYALTFRQFYDSKEHASFANTFAILNRTAASSWGEDSSILLELNRWNTAQKKLLQFEFEDWCRSFLTKTLPERILKISPRQLVDLQLYGDLIHFGKVNELDELASDEFWKAWYLFKFASIMREVSAIYIGVGIIASRMLGNI